MCGLTSTTGCLRYDHLLKSDDQAQFTHIYVSLQLRVQNTVSAQPCVRK